MSVSEVAVTYAALILHDDGIPITVSAACYKKTPVVMSRMAFSLYRLFVCDSSSFLV